jgi:hypothetical protein
VARLVADQAEQHEPQFAPVEHAPPTAALAAALVVAAPAAESAKTAAATPALAEAAAHGVPTVTMAVPMIAALVVAAMKVESESHDRLFPVFDVLRYILDIRKGKSSLSTSSRRWSSRQNAAQARSPWRTQRLVEDGGNASRPALENRLAAKAAR